MSSFNVVRSVQRGFDILQLVNSNIGKRTQELAELGKVPRPTAHRLLKTMEMLGYVVFDADRDGWYPTVDARTLSSGFREEAWVAREAMPRMMALGRRVHWPISLLTFSNFAMLVRETTHHHSPFPMDGGQVGQSVPMLFTASGRAYLATCPEDERAAIIEGLRRMDKPEYQWAWHTRSLDTMLQQIRSTGFGTCDDGWRPNMPRISAPVFYNGRVVACMTVIWTKHALTVNQAIDRFAESLLEICDLISRDLSEHTHVSH